jgi:hypothetical protein
VLPYLTNAISTFDGSCGMELYSEDVLKLVEFKRNWLYSERFRTRGSQFLEMAGD